jgi:prophage regulatory protein
MYGNVAFPFDRGIASAMNSHESETILREKQVIRVTGLGRSSVWSFGNPRSRYYDPTFPKPIKLGTRAVGWKASEVFFWVASRTQAA